MQKNHRELARLLGNLYLLVEHGDPCYENGDPEGAYLGQAVRIPEAMDRKIVAQLDRFGVRVKPYGVQTIYNPGVEGATSWFATFERALAHGLEKVRQSVARGQGDLVLLFNVDNVDLDWQDGLTEAERDQWYAESSMIRRKEENLVD